MGYIPEIGVDIACSQSLVQDKRPSPAIAPVDAVPVRIPVVAQVAVLRLPHAPVGVELVRDIA